jgi:serine/threonine-protein kinase
MSQDTRIGTEIAEHTILSVIGRGGMSVVYLATQEFPKRKVALKLLAPELAEESGFRERFIRESNAAASLDHPNVIPIYGAGEDRGVLWIAMRYVEGTDLAHLIDTEGALPAERTVHIVEQVAAALDAAHDIGLVHRDVKPGNILLARSDHAYLTDFGIIKRREAGTDFTKTGDFLGTVAYAAPEQIRGDPVDGRADVYSLGCVTYECLTGEPPYPRDAEVAVMYAHLNDPPPRPTATRPELPPGIDDVVAKAMAERVDRRYASAGELAGAVRTTLAPITPLALQPTRRMRSLLIAAAVALVVLAAGLGLVARGRGSSNPSPPPAKGASTGPTSPAPPAAFSGIVRIDPKTDRIVARIPSGGPNQFFEQGKSVALTRNAVWEAVGGFSVGRGVKINPEVNAVVADIPSMQSPLAADSTIVWWETYRGEVVGVDARTNRVTHRIHLSVVATANNFLAVGGGSVWAVFTEHRGYSVWRIDARTNQVKEIPVPGSPTAVAFGAGRFWYLDTVAGTVRSVDPGTNKVSAPQRLVGTPTKIAVGAGAIWILDTSEGLVQRVPIAGNAAISPINVGKDAVALAVGEGAVWVVNHGDGSVSKIDLAGGGVVDTIHVTKGTACQLGGNEPCGRSGASDIAVGAGGVWVATAS